MNTAKEVFSPFGIRCRPEAFIVAVVFMIGLPVLLVTYGFTDDYSFLVVRSDPDHPSFWNDITGMGRPITAVITVAVFRTFSTIESLAWVRLIGVIGVVVFAVVLYRGMLLRQWPGYQAVCASLCITLSPAFVVYMGWAVTFLYPVGAILAFHAGYSFCSRLSEGRQEGLRARWVSLLYVLFAVFIASAIYQPTAAFTLFSGLLFLRQGSGARRLADELTLILSLVFVFFIGIALYYAVFRFSIQPHFRSDAFSDRASLLSDPVRKAGFIFSSVIPDLLRSWASLVPERFSPVSFTAMWIHGVLALWGIYVLSSARQGFTTETVFSSGIRLAFISIVFIGSLLPVIAVDGDYAPFRVLPVSFAVVLFLSTVGFFSLVDRLIPGDRFSKVFICFVPMSLYLAGVVWGLVFGIVQPQSKELALYRAELEGFESRPSGLMFIYPYGQPAPGPVPAKHEFGLPSFTLEWVPGFSFALIADQLWPEEAGGITVVQIWPWQQGSDYPYPVIDGRQVISGEMTAPRSAYQNVRTSQWLKGDIVLPFLGRVDNLNWNWIQHPQLGYLRLSRKPAGYFDAEKGEVLVPRDSQMDGVVLWFPDGRPRLKIHAERWPMVEVLDEERFAPVDDFFRESRY
jgi:hypothetical protein